jgi:hypothetical protein
MATNPNGKYNIPPEDGSKKPKRFLYTAKDVESDEVTQIKKDICARIILSQQVNSGEMLNISCQKYGIGVQVFMKWLEMDGMQEFKEEFAMCRHHTSKLSANNLSAKALQAISDIIDNPEETVIVRKEKANGDVECETRTKRNRELQVSAAKFLVERSLPTYSLALRQQNIAGAIELIKAASRHAAVTPELSMILRKVLIEFLRGKGVPADALLELDSPDIVDIDVDDLIKE